jgi:hypothetical protein
LMPLPQAHEREEQVSHIPLFQTLGILLSLYALHWQHDSQSVTQWLGKGHAVFTASTRQANPLETSRSHIFTYNY